uniref:uncharacterized protein rab44 n=1 Tax=Scatophagus argus TaxID=75038 RepID=UPI001ED82B69|nr:uncharacterized protein rab44 [Scatophagus argus]XP_046239532.1 uncharacterized protein rab44 [Scatophagus argus]
MSAQSAKKKRIGSRRRLANQNKTSEETEESNITDSTSGAQWCVQEEITESLNVLANADNSQSEAQNPLSPGLSENRKILGSSRRNKGQHVKDLATELHHKPREDVEKTRSYETLQTTQMSLSIQLKRKEEISQGSQHDIISAAHDSSLHSTNIPDYYSEVHNTATSCPEADLKGSTPKSENLLADQDESGIDYKVATDSCKSEDTMTGGADKSNTSQTEKLEENAHLVVSELTSLGVLSCSTVGEKQIDLSQTTEMREEQLPNVDFVTEKESDDTDLLRQNENFQGNCLLSESHQNSVDIQFSNTQVITSDRSSPRKNAEFDCSVEQAIFSSPNEDEQNDHFNFQVSGSQHSEDAMNNESMTHGATEKSEMIPGHIIDQAEVSDTYQREFIAKSSDDSAAKQEDSDPEDQEVHPTKVNSSEALDHTNEDNYVYDANELQISGIERAQAAPDQVNEGRVEDDIKPSAEPTVHQEKEGVLSEMEASDSSFQSRQSGTQAPLDPQSQPQADDTGLSPMANRRKLGSSRRNKGRQHAMGKSNHRPTEEVVGNTDDYQHLETTKMSLAVETEEVNDQVGENARVGTPVGITELITSSFHSSSTVDQHLIDRSNSTEMAEEELPNVYSVTEMESNERDEDTNLSYVKSEDAESSVTADITTEQSSPGENTDIECSVEEAAFSPSKEELCSNEEHKEHLNLSQVRGSLHSEDVVNKVHEEEVKPTQMHQIDFFQTVESESSLQILQSEMNVPLECQPQDNSVRTEEQTHTGFSPVGNRRKLGSSRKSKGRQHAKDPVTEAHYEPKEEFVEIPRGDEVLETTKMLFAIETNVQEKSMGTILEGMDTFGASQAEEVSDQLKENVHFGPVIGNFELTTSSLHSGSTGDQQLIDQSYSKEMAGDEISNVTVKESKDRDEDTELFRHDGNLQSNYLVRESQFKSEEIEFSETPDMSTEKLSPREHAEPERSVEQTIISSTKEELPSSVEENETVNLTEVEGAHHLEDAVNNIREQEFKPTQMHEINHSLEIVIHDATEKSEMIPGHIIDQAEVSDTYQREFIAKSSDDSAAKQEDSDPEDQDVHPTKVNSSEALDHTNEDNYVYDANELQISIIERSQTAPDQVNEGRVEDDIKPSAEPTVHQEKEGVLSEMEESDSSFQSRQSGTQAPLDSQSQPQADDTGLSPMANRRKLGSSRRNKGRQNAMGKSNHRPTEEVVGNTDDYQHLETTKMSLAVEIEEVNDQVGENVHVGTPVGITELITSSFHSSSTVDQHLIDRSNSTEMAEEELPNVYSVTEMESNERDEDTNLSYVKSEDAESSVTADITTEQSSPGENTDIECSVEEAAFSPSKEELCSNEEHKEHLNLSQVRGSLQSEDVVNEVHEEEVKPTQIPQIDIFQTEESESSLQILQSEMNVPLECQPQDNSVRTEEQTHTGFNPVGNRRKLGSSRKSKGRQHAKDPVKEAHYEPKEEFVEISRGDEVLETTKMSFAIETMRQSKFKKQTDLDLTSTQKTGKIRSAVNDEESMEKMREGGIILSQNTLDNTESVTIDNASSTDKDDSVKSKNINDEEKNPIKESETFSQLTGYDTVNYVIIKDCNTEVGRSVEVFRQDDVGENVEDPANKDREAQEMKASQAVTHAERFSATHNKTETSAAFVPGENVRAELVVVMPDESVVSTAVDSCNSQQTIQEKTNLANCENLQGKSKQKRRKMGSTRRPQLSRKLEEEMDSKDETQESDFNTQTDAKNVDRTEVMEELPVVLTAEVSQNENAKPSLNPVYKEQQETDETSAVDNKGQKLQSSMISDIDDSTALLPGQSASSHEEVKPAMFVHVSDTKDNETHVNLNMAPLVSNTEDITNPGLTGERRSFVSTTQSTQNDEERLESMNVTQHEALKSAEAPAVAVVDLEIMKSVVSGRGGEEHKDAQASIHEPNNPNGGDHNKNLEMKNASPNLNSTSRRRKMGSTRRNLGSRSKGEDLHQRQGEDDEATEAATDLGDVKMGGFKTDDGDSERKKEKLFETAEYSHTSESHSEPPSQQTVEEILISHGQPKATEHHPSPNYLPASPSSTPKHDAVSETASGGRRRKLGSHRKSHGHQSNENGIGRGNGTADTQTERDVRSIINESAIKRAEEEPVALDKISEVDECDKKPSSNINASKTGGPTMPVSEKTVAQVTPVPSPSAEIRLSQESQKMFSLEGSSRGGALRSLPYNVMMVGDSSVGKTSFMKRAHTGKFSLDLPASVGLDSCKWTVVVDGNPVVLQLWDTAGQERFHSITKQIFHKAQAFLLMYDITSHQSFSAVSYWANCIQEGAAENVTILLLGNKSDHAERKVKTQEGEILAKEYNFGFMECSAATGDNVIQSLETVARMLSQKDDTRRETTQLHKEPQQKKSGCC